MNSHRNDPALLVRILALSVREAWRNKLGLLMFFLIPVLFLGLVQITAGEGYTSINLYYPGETLQIMLTIRHVCIVFAAAGLCGFLSSYYALTLFHQNFDYFRYCVFNGLRPAVFLAGRFAFLIVMILLLAAATTVLTGALVTITNYPMVFAGFVLIGIVYGACGGIAGTMIRDVLAAFLFIALLADLDAAWLQNPVYYTSGQNLGLIKWLPAFYPCQMIFAAGFTEDQNPDAIRGSILYAVGLLSVLLVIISLRLRGVRGVKRSAVPQPAPVPTPGGKEQ